MNDIRIGNSLSKLLTEVREDAHASAQNNSLSVSKERMLKIQTLIKDAELISNTETFKKTLLLSLHELQFIGQQPKGLLEHFDKIVKRINGLIVIHIFRDLFYELDEFYFSLAPNLIFALRRIKPFAEDMISQNSPKIFQCLPQLAFIFLFFECIPENSKQWSNKFPIEGARLLNDRIDQLADRTSPWAIEERTTLQKHTITALYDLFSLFEEMFSAFKVPNDIQKCIYRKITLDPLTMEEEDQIKPYEKLLGAAESFAYIISHFNQVAINSIMKLTLASDEKFAQLTNPESP